MNVTEFFLTRWEAELPAFVRVLKAVPEGKLDFRPHEKSTSAGALAWQLVEEQRALLTMLNTGTLTWNARPHPATGAEIVEEWEKVSGLLGAKLKELDEEKSSVPTEFVSDGHSVWKDTVGNMLWAFLFDMVHHRGQLSTYLRPMGGKVPSIYGPSADDMGG